MLAEVKAKSMSSANLHRGQGGHSGQNGQRKVRRGIRVRYMAHGVLHEITDSDQVFMDGKAAPRHSGTGYAASGGYVTACFESRDNDCAECRLCALCEWIDRVQRDAGVNLGLASHDPAEDRRLHGYRDRVVGDRWSRNADWLPDQVDRVALRAAYKAWRSAGKK